MELEDEQGRMAGNGLRNRCFCAASSALWLMLILAGLVPRTESITQESRRPIDRKIVEYPRLRIEDRSPRVDRARRHRSRRRRRGVQGFHYRGRERKQAEFAANLRLEAQWNLFQHLSRLASISPRSGFCRTSMTSTARSEAWSSTKGAFVTHRDSNGHGVVSSFGFDGSCVTVVGDLPAQGDYGMGDITVNPKRGRLFL